MRYHADLHVHSPYSRGVSPQNDLFHLAYWARRKGIAVMGTGDFTYPAWLAALENELVAAEPGFFRLRDDLDEAVTTRLEAPCRGSTRFVLSVEVSTIYKKDGRGRAIHHLVYVPDFAAARKVVTALAKIGNIQSDGRPILGLDSRHLLEIVLESGPGSFLVPAHVWTPYFGLFGSVSGFDSVEACYGDLSPNIFALETGLSSDPRMNYRISKHDRYHLLSCSDAHSAPKLGREATIFDTGFDFFSMRRALETGEGLAGTIEFFPEEGKYHLDGHRDCKVRLNPAETRALGGICSVCRKPLTVGVLSRVEDLADRDQSFVRSDMPPFTNLVPLLEVLAELAGKTVKNPKVQESYRGLLTRLGSELFILEDAPLDLIQKADSSMLAEGIRRMREKQVHAEPGFDGEGGVIHLFSEAELRAQRSNGLFVDLGKSLSAPKTIKPAKEPTRKTKAAPKKEKIDSTLFVTREPPARPSVLDGLDDDQKAAARVVSGPLLVVAGPGTGKTRTLTHRIAFLVKEMGVLPENILAITFTRRAADEMRERLGALLGEAGARVATFTFHALGLHILQRYGDSQDISLLAEPERAGIITRALSVPTKKAEKLVAAITILKRRYARRVDALARGDESLRQGSELDLAWEVYERELDEKNLVDFEDLVTRSVLLLESKPDVLEAVRACYPYISVDEFQDVDERQYRLLFLMAGDKKNVCAIGDPDQAIYGFRGSDVSFFFRFREDYPATSVVRLGKNYRSTRAIVDAALSVIATSPTIGERVLRPISQNDSRIGIHVAKSEVAEAEWAVLTIERLLGGTSMFSRDSRRVGPGDYGATYSFSDFAILYRTDAQAQAFCEALKRSGMPFQKRTHARVAERAAAIAIMRALGPDQPTLPLVDALALAATEVQKVALVASEGSEPQTKQEEPQEERFGQADVDAALAVLRGIAERSGGETTRFRYEVLIEVEVDGWDPRAERISLLTLHASKGLEFPVVFLVGCEDGLLPLRFAGREDAVDEAEERRLFFVGMTRAKERLFLSRSERRKRHGKVVAMSASPFLGEIEARLVDDDHDTEAQKDHAITAKMQKKQMTLF